MAAQIKKIIGHADRRPLQQVRPDDRQTPLDIGHVLRGGLHRLSPHGFENLRRRGERASNSGVLDKPPAFARRYGARGYWIRPGLDRWGPFQSMQGPGRKFIGESLPGALFNSLPDAMQKI